MAARHVVQWQGLKNSLPQENGMEPLRAAIIAIPGVTGKKVE